MADNTYEVNNSNGIKIVMDEDSKLEPINTSSSYMTVYKPIAGWKAVVMTVDAEGMAEPWQTSPFAFATKDQAIETHKDYSETINNWEYLVNVSSVRNQGHEYIDQEYWFKWSNNWFVTKTKYVSKESRDLEFFDYDARFRLRHNNFNFTIGAVLRAHPIYGHPAIGDYEGLWWDLAYEYGYQDYLVPLNDLNENGEIDSYYLWIETDPDTEEGYWIYYYEDADFYWEDANANTVAYSDAEFLQYHYPHVVHMYNEDNKIEEWQSEINVALGFDILFGGEKFYSHLWVNAFPESYGLTDKAYDGKDMQYDVGTVIGANLSEHIGVYIEGIYQNYYGRAEHNVMAGLNWRF